VREYTIDELDKITNRANDERDNIFKDMDWPLKTPLTHGDVRVILNARELIISGKPLEKSSETEEGA
jgi:hypothetical protein